MGYVDWFDVVSWLLSSILFQVGFLWDLACLRWSYGLIVVAIIVVLVSVKMEVISKEFLY